MGCSCPGTVQISPARHTHEKLSAWTGGPSEHSPCSKSPSVHRESFAHHVEGSTGCMNTHTYAHTCIFTCTPTHGHTHTHSYMHTQTHRAWQGPRNREELCQLMNWRLLIAIVPNDSSLAQDRRLTAIFVTVEWLDLWWVACDSRPHVFLVCSHLINQWKLLMA